MIIIAISGKKQSGKDTVGRIIQELCLGHSNIEITESINSNKATKEQKEDSGWEIKKFADKLKDIVCLLIGCTREDLEDETFKNTELGEEWWYWENSFGKRINYLDNITYGSTAKDGLTSRKLIKLTPRLLLQLLGTECGRNIIHPNIWINSLMNDYKLTNNSGLRQEGLHYPNWIITDLRFPNELESIKSKGGISIRVNRHNHPNDVNPNTEHESETALDNTEFDYTIINNGNIEDLIEKVKQILIKENIL